MSYLRKGAIKFVLDSRLENVWMVGVAVKSYCLESGFSQDASASVEVALVEAVNNTIIHAYHSQAGHPVEIRVILEPERIVFHIEDQGDGFSPRPRSETVIDPSDITSLPEGGYGLMLIHGIMDQVEYQSTGKNNLLIMSKWFA